MFPLVVTDWLLNPWVWLRTQRPCLSSRHVVPHLLFRGSRNHRTPLLLSRHLPALISPAWILITSPVMTSLDSGVPVRVSWPELYLEILHWGRRFSYLRRKDEAKKFLNHLLHSRKCISRVPGDALNKYSFWLDCTYHSSVTLLGIFPRGFADRVDILLPRQRTLSQPITFGLVNPNVTPQITCAHAHPKFMTFSGHLSSLKILREYDQYALGWFGVIIPSWALACYRIKIGLKLRERT